MTLSGEAPLDLDQVSAFLRERIARFKVPKQIVVVDELPKTATGKIQKHLLRDASRRP